MSAPRLSLSSIPDFDPRDLPVEHRDDALPAIAPERLSQQALRARFANPPQWAPEFTSDRWPARPEAPRAAAVLVPIVVHEHETTILLTERTSHLSKHAGEVAFPGGRRDPEDPTLDDTALREAEEEIGLTRDRVDIVARLPEYLTGTGYLVTPIIGFVRPGFELQLHVGEVAAAFEVPLRFLMDPSHHERRRIIVYGEIDRFFYAMPWRPSESEREYFIWGATAAMLRNLYRLLSA